MKTKNKKSTSEMPVFKPEEILSINEMRYVYGGDGDGGESIILMPPPPPRKQE